MQEQLDIARCGMEAELQSRKAELEQTAEIKLVTHQLAECGLVTYSGGRRSNGDSWRKSGGMSWRC